MRSGLTAGGRRSLVARAPFREHDSGTVTVTVTVPHGSVNVQSTHVPPFAMRRLRLAAATAAAASTLLLLLLSLAPATGQMQIATFAGSNGGDGGLASSAGLRSDPAGVAADAAGNIYVIDECRIRRIASGTGIITALAGTGNCSFMGDGGPATSGGLAWPQGVAVDSGGNVLIADTQQPHPACCCGHGHPHHAGGFRRTWMGGWLQWRRRPRH